MRLTPKPSSIPVYTGIELPLNGDYNDWDHTPSLSDYANDVFTVIMPIMIFAVIMLMNMCVMKVFLSDFQSNCFFFYGSFRQLSWYLGKDHKEIYTKFIKLIWLGSLSRDSLASNTFSSSPKSIPIPSRQGKHKRKYLSTQLKPYSHINWI